MTPYELTGRVVEVGDVQSFGLNGFTKRDLIVDTAPDEAKWRNPVKVTFKKDATALLNGLAVGQKAKVKFHVDGRRWDGPKGTQHFVDLVGVEIETAATVRNAATAQAAQPEEPPAEEDYPF